MRSQVSCWTTFLLRASTIAGFLGISLNCSGGKTDAPSAPPTPATPTALTPPVVTLSLSAARLRANSDSGVLTWTTTNATGCVASGAWSGAQPLASSLWIKPTSAGSYTYTLQCTGAGGTTTASTVVEAWLPIPVARTSYENWKINGRGEVKFPPGTGWRVFGGGTNAYGFGDFFQTGRRDLVTASLNYRLDKPYVEQMGVPAFMSDLEVWREASDGSWTRVWTGKGCLHPRKILVVDFNTDGVPDVFTSCTGWDGAITNGAVRGETSRIFLSNGRDSFTTKEVGSNTGYLHSASAADLDHDGYADIVVGDIAECCNKTDGYDVFALMNQRDGTFSVDKTRIPRTTNGQYVAVELLDVDADGNVDLLLGSGWSATNPEQKPPLLLYGDATGHFGQSGRQVTLPEAPGRGIALDFSLVENAGKRGLYVGRTGGYLSGFYYATITLQYVDFATLTSSIVLDQSANTGFWVAWWMPVQRNGRNGVVPYASKAENGTPLSFFFAP